MCNMAAVERIAQVVAWILGMSVLGFAAGICLGTLHAGVGWYYGVGLALAGIGAFRVLEPTGGISPKALGSAWRRHKGDRAGTPHPTA